MDVKIFGAGSVGNHFTYACRSLNHNVDIVDIDVNALKRMKEDIYPKRYQAWDENINLFEVYNVPKKKYDLSIIGTPPHTHVGIALKELEETCPKILLIEKALSDPLLKDCEKLWKLSKSSKTKVLVGYNHNLTAQSIEAKKLLKKAFWVGQYPSLHVLESIGKGFF